MTLELTVTQWLNGSRTGTLLIQSPLDARLSVGIEPSYDNSILQNQSLTANKTPSVCKSLSNPKNR